MRYLNRYISIILFTVLLTSCKKSEEVAKETITMTTEQSVSEKTSKVNAPTINETMTMLEVLGTDEITSSDQYIKHINVPATDQMPNLYFELTGRMEKDEYLATIIYYPIKMVIKTDDTIIQVIKFNEGDFVPCRTEDFGFEYGDFRFDGYGGFRIICSSTGKNPSYYVWIWDKNKNNFVEYPDLEMVGYMTFDYDKQLINVSNNGGGDFHEFLTYKYINDKLTIIEKIIDADQDGKRRIYKLKDGELELFEITESQLKG